MLSGVYIARHQETKARVKDLYVELTPGWNPLHHYVLQGDWLRAKCFLLHDSDFLPGAVPALSSHSCKFLFVLFIASRIRSGR